MIPFHGISFATMTYTTLKYAARQAYSDKEDN